MILRIRHIKIPARVERHAPGVRKSPGLRARPSDDFNWPVVRVENLDAAVAELADKLVSICVDANVVGITQVAFARASPAIRTDELPVARKNLDAMIARVRHVKPVLRIHANPFGPIELTRSDAGFADNIQQPGS